MRTIRALAVGMLAALITVTAAPAMAAPAAEPAVRVAMVPAVQEFYWDWSDGVDSRTRTFRQSKYEIQENLPTLIVTADPAQPQQYVKLQYKQGGTWKREDAGLTNGKGIAELQLNPYCESGDWCDSTFKYRLLVNGKYTLFTITYIR